MQIRIIVYLILGVLFFNFLLFYLILGVLLFNFFIVYSLFLQPMSALKQYKDQLKDLKTLKSTS
jgi:hypothetical protein